MIIANLGEAVRRLRDRNRMSLRTLAEKADFSPSFISQVENGQASPSISSMERIASALGVTLGEFFRTAEGESSVIVKADTRTGLSFGWSKANIEACSQGSNLGHKMEATVVTLFPGGTSGKRPVAGANEEFAMVLSGAAGLVLGDQPEQILGVGDSVTIRAGVPRQWKNDTETPTQVLIVAAV